MQAVCRWSGILLVVLGLTGCGQGGGAPQNATQAEPVNAIGASGDPVEEPAAPVVITPPAMIDLNRPLSDAECKAFGEAVAAALNGNDIPRLNQLVAWPNLLAGATDKIPAPENINKDFLADVLGSLDRADGFWPQIISHAGHSHGEIARYMSVHGTGAKRGVVVRVVLPDSVTYFDLLVARSGGEVAATDIFSFLSGEPVSQSLRRAYISAVAASNRDVAAQLTGWEHDFAASLGVLDQMTSLLPDKPLDWLAAYPQLPVAVQRDKSLLLTRLEIARQASDEAFAAAITDLKNSYNNDPSVELLLANLFAQAGQHAELLESLKRLDQSIGGDPFLWVWQANALVALNKSPEARNLVTNAMRVEPKLRHSYWTLVMLSLSERKYAETVAVLRVLEEQLGVEFDDFATHPEYTDFVKSGEYQEWSRNRPVPATVNTAVPPNTATKPETNPNAPVNRLR